MDVHGINSTPSGFSAEPKIREITQEENCSPVASSSPSLVGEVCEEDKVPPPPIEIVVKHETTSPNRLDKLSYVDESDEEDFHEALENSPLSKWPPGELGESVGHLELTEDESGAHTARMRYAYHRKSPGGKFRGKKSRHSRSASEGGSAEFVEERGGDVVGEVEDEEFEVEMEEEDIFAACFPTLDQAKEHAGHFVRKVWEASWKVTHFYSLPEWLQDNDYLHTGHRPPLPSFSACFKSIFRIHTETGNIWSHMIGCVLFIGVAGYFLTRAETEVQWQEKLVFSAFFTGAIACLGLSFAFHTLHCHSEKVGKIFSKLDYVGITLMIIGSFIPWLFYGFYCYVMPKVVYSLLVTLLGVGCIVVSLLNRFSRPKFRPLRAGMFVGLGLSGVVPCMHYFATEGVWSALYEASLGWLLLMAVFYIFGALLYAFRIPERYFPGKFDLWFQSHQLFHLCVIVAALIHYHGITEMAVYRLQGGSCEEQLAKLTWSYTDY